MLKSHEKDPDRPAAFPAPDCLRPVPPGLRRAGGQRGRDGDEGTRRFPRFRRPGGGGGSGPDSHGRSRAQRRQRRYQPRPLLFKCAFAHFASQIGFQRLFD